MDLISDSPEDDNSNSAFRVRNVFEINSDYTDTPKKRKLPTWLNPSQTEASSSDSVIKRHRTDEVNISSTANFTSNKHGENVANKENNTIDGKNNCSTHTDEPKHTTEKLDISNKKITIDNNSAANSDTMEKSNSDSENHETTNPKETLILPKPIKTEIKEETVSSSESSSTSNTINIKKENVKDEPSSTSRESCKYGIRCYRRNPQHRIEEAHPGDNDYRRPTYPPPPKGTPDCPFGSLCYRRNPSHFQDFSHPPSTDFKKNFLNHQNQRRLRITAINYTIDNNDDLDENEEDLNDFIDDGSDDEFVPTDDSDEDFE